jgi:O-antigen/teichoic acid export membrane protein
MNIGYVIYTAGILLTLQHDWGLYGIAVTMVVQQVMATMLIVPAAFRHLERRWSGFMSRAELKEFWRYALHTQWSDLMLLVTLQTDAIVVGAFLPVRQVAYYGAGANFALQMYNVPVNALVPMQSVLGQAVGSEGPEAATADFERLQRLWVIGATGWGVVATSAAWFGITAWLGPEFSVSGVVAVVMLLAYQMTLWASVLGVWTQVLGRPELNARSASAGAAANVVLTLALVVPFGILGTVVATAISQVLAALLLLRVARRRLAGHTRSFLTEVPVIPAAVAAVVVVGLEILVRPVVPEGALGLILTGLAAAPGLVVYGAMAFGPRTVWRFVRDRVRQPL